jgi:hypothetical protein
MFNFIYHISDYLFNTRIVNEFPNKYYYKYPYQYANSYNGFDFLVDRKTKEPEAHDHLFQIDIAGLRSDDYENGMINFRLNYQNWDFKSSLKTYIPDTSETVSSFSLIAERKTYSLSFWDSSMGIGYNGAFFESERKDNLILSASIEVFPVIPLSISANVQKLIGDQSALIQTYTANIHILPIFIGVVYNKTNYDKYIKDDFVGVRFGYYY